MSELENTAGTVVQQVNTIGPRFEVEAVKKFRASLRGELLLPEDRDFDTARKVVNGAIDKTPALIVRCVGVADVMSSVKFARMNELTVAVRGGGHNVAGNAVCDDGIVIDLSCMRSIRVDPERRTADAEAGARWRGFCYGKQGHGVGAPRGVGSSNGI